MNIYSALFQCCGDAIVIADSQGKIVFHNSKAEDIFHEDFQFLLDADSDSTCCLFEVDTELETRKMVHPLSNALAGEILSDREFLFRSTWSETDVWLSVSGWPIDQTVSQVSPGAILIIRDITHRQSEQAQKSQTTFRDKLTGLVNRTVLLDRLQQALIPNERDQNHRVALLCLDVRRLKAINDSFGYLAGDELLVELIRRFKQTLRPEDTLARFGGDEFTILLENIESSVQAINQAEAIHSMLSAPILIQGFEINAEVSIGISLSNTECREPEMLLRQADLAMYRAKQSFGNQYCVFEDHMKADVEDSLHLEIALKRAIENNEMLLQYQPIFMVRTQEIIGLESLVRWPHPTEGIISPVKFIPLAEKTGLIIPLGWWVLEESCRQLKIWQNEILAAEDLFVSVNMSSKQFVQKDVPQKIEAILNKVGLSPRSLKIEITESVLIEHSSSIISTLEAIRAMGIKLSIDDFGTGYSSLSYLHRFPFDTLKIDRSFIENADADFEKLEILQSVVRLAWNLGLEVVAEGIETPKHFAQIKALRCESGQGFLFSKPLYKEDFEALLQTQNQNQKGREDTVE